ncbi:MAG: hypothetical protein R3E66_15235 [bacterium]
MSQVNHLSFFWGIALVLIFSGCATGDIGDEQAACTNDAMCSPDVCNLATGKCEERNATDVAIPDVSTPQDMNTVNTPDMGTDAHVEEDMNTPLVCTPACEANEACVDGRVSRLACQRVWHRQFVPRTVVSRRHARRLARRVTQRRRTKARCADLGEWRWCMPS